ncbi:MAG: DEAD/DEAH box helicase, partial [Actinobacteria bacterium]|nr:DEAD/DEAH box helicase [Actinomycetota bacterium]
AIARKHLRDPKHIRIGDEVRSSEEAQLVRHSAYMVQRSHKAAALGRILDVESPTAALVFCRTREAVDNLTETMNGRGYRSEALHGGMSQEQRDRVMGRLRSGSADLLVATDVAARGLDIDHLTHVINYDVPSSVDTYVHRMGRVGRAGREGVAITLAEPREHRMLKTIENVTKKKISVEKLPTVADLKARRLDLTRAALRESILEEDLDGFRVVVESLSEEFDLMEVALAAVSLAHSAIGGPDDEEDIPDVVVSSAPKGQGRDGREGRDSRDGRPNRNKRASSGGGPGSTRLYVSLGREAGVRPQDLVGAISGETSLSGRDIGSIEISGRFSLVDVPEGAVDEVIEALRNTKIRGRRVTIRRERF